MLGGTLIDITLTDGGDDRPSPAAASEGLLSCVEEIVQVLEDVGVTVVLA
ncbi:hypothetical protein [Streptomyces sp. NRRL S-1813]|nr:hypothetical protein [Streptomyces sp. NRRL S-1813]